MKFSCTLILLLCLAPLSSFGKDQISREDGIIGDGKAWKTEYHVIDSGKEGPVVLVVAGIHGDKPAGVFAASQIANWPIVAGKLIVIPRANASAVKAKTRRAPGAPKEAGDLNRNFPQVVRNSAVQVAPLGELAGALWQFTLKYKPDWIIDLHEGAEFRISHDPSGGGSKSIGSTMIYLGDDKMDTLAKKVVSAANKTESDKNRKFSLIRSGPVSSGFARSCCNALGSESLILATTSNHQPLSLRTRQHRVMVNVLLNDIGMIDRDCSMNLASPRSKQHLQVGLFDGEGTGPSSFVLMDVIAEAEDLTLHHVGPGEMKDETLKQFDVVVFPGGSGSKQAKDIGESGRTALTKFVSSGGGYVGVCAGAYLCSSGYDWSLNFIDSRPLTGKAQDKSGKARQLWYRGSEAGIDMELTDKGKAVIGDTSIPGTFEVRYANGPIISTHKSGEADNYEVLAWFRSENGNLERHKGTMINTPAIVSNEIGNGRVASISPHPELTETLHPIITQIIRWVGKKHL